MGGWYGVTEVDFMGEYLYRKSVSPDSLFDTKGSRTNHLFSIDPENTGFLMKVGTKGNLGEELFCIDPGATMKGSLEREKICIDPRICEILLKR